MIYRENGDRENLFIDEAWGYDTALELIQRGADVIFAAGGATGQGALRAADQSAVNAIGTERDQGAVLAKSGSHVVTSIFGRARFEVQNMMRLLKSGDSYQPDLVKLSMCRLGDFPHRKPDSWKWIIYFLRCKTGKSRRVCL